MHQHLAYKEKIMTYKVLSFIETLAQLELVPTKSFKYQRTFVKRD